MSASKKIPSYSHAPTPPLSFCHLSVSLSLILSDHLLILSVVCMVVVLPGVLLDSLGMSMWEETVKEWKKSDLGRYTHFCPFGHVCLHVYVCVYDASETDLCLFDQR